MPGSALVVLGSIAVAALEACAAPRQHSQAPENERYEVIQDDGATVLTSRVLHQSRLSLLDILQQRLPNLHVDGTGNCPEVYLRGRSSIAHESNAAIFVDGQEAVNSCILEAIFAFDLDRVEVYPMGVTTRPGYRSDPDGLILIFVRRADP